MDAIVDKCLKCGTPLLTPRKLKDFCSYSCRGQHAVDALDGAKYQTALSGSKNTRKNRALRTLKQQGVGAITFCKINSVTYRVDRRNKNGAGWLMEVAWPSETRQQRWVARVRDRASEPLPLEAAKKAAMLDERGKAEPHDWIAELNQIAANEVGRVVIEREKRTWPIDLMGGRQRGHIDPKLHQAILDTERILVDDERVTPGALQGDDYPIEMDADG